MVFLKAFHFSLTLLRLLGNYVVENHMIQRPV